MKTATSEAEHIGPEAALLLSCARTCVDPECAERIRTLVQGNIDWASVIRMAYRHGTMPLLYWSLHAACPDAVPKTVMAQLREHFHANALCNLFLTDELLKLLELFKAHDIFAMAFKGPILAGSVYGNLSLRQFGDLDILVHQREAAQAKNLLISQGYQLTRSHLQAQDVADFPSKYHILLGKNSKVRVDLQWQITGPSFTFPLDADRLREHLEPIPLGGTTVLNFPLPDLLAILCVHGCKHCWERLKWVCDIAELVRCYPKTDWQEIMAHAGRMGTKRMLALGLFLASDLLGATLPEQVVDRLRADPMVERLATRVRQQLFRKADGPIKVLERPIFYLRMRERSRDRRRYCLHYAHQYLRIAMTPSAHDRAILALPTFLSFVYYLIRPLRLLQTYSLRPRQLKRVLCEWFEIID